MSHWNQIRDFFNSKKSNKCFTRAEYFTKFEGSKDSYLDTCRLYLTKAGFLKQEEDGLYRKVKPIPKDLTSTQCKELAYPGSKKRTNFLGKLYREREKRYL